MPSFRSSLLAVAALALLAACDPEYRSGATVCAPKEPRCPDGYVCSGIRCYLPSDVPKDGGVLGGTPGTAGAGGMGGVPGTAGTIGTGGRGGSAGTGGAAGTPMAGRGGSVGTDASPSAFPAYPPAAMCMNIVPENECNACNYSRCCGELQACVGNASCQSFIRCFNACNDDAACEQACETNNQAGYAVFLPFAQCFQGPCRQACGQPSPPTAPDAGPPRPSDAGPPRPSDAAPPPPPPGGSSAMKFCNDLYLSDGTPEGRRAINLELQLGTITLNALSGNCVPIPGTACTAMPSGNQMLVFRDPADGEVIVQEMVNVVAGTSYVFIGHFPQGAMRPIVTTETRTAAECSAYSPDNLP